MSANGKKQQIQSYVRVRPLNQFEKEQRSHPVIEATNKEVNVKQNGCITKTFTFDKVFGPKSKQLDVYTTVVSPFIKEVLAGYNCTVFAYGQTGTGKTYTMAGGSENGPDSAWQADPEAGIIPRTLNQLFDELRVLQVEHTVRVSYLELYNEELFDLLSVTDDSKLRLYEDSVKKGSVIIHGLEEINVHNKNEVYKILKRGSIRRQTASTLMNAQSSRSHTIFSIIVHIKDTSVENVDLLRTGKLNLVDLAGSENIGRSGAVDKRAREAGNINQSLLTLGRVITSLVENAPHVPYRESKLTRLLQDSLGGRTKTSIIATVSPAACNLEETLSTLEYARRAKNITNRPEANQRFSKATLIKHYTDEIERLQRDLFAARSGEGFFLSSENYHQMVNEIENYGQEMADKINQIKALCDEMEKKNELCEKLNLELTETKATLMDKVDELNKKTENLEETEFLVQKLSKTEHTLGQQAKTLLHVVDAVSQDTSKLHDKIDTVKKLHHQNTQVSSQFQKQYLQNLRNMDTHVFNEIHSQNNLIKHFMNTLLSIFDSEQIGTEQLQIKLQELSSKREELFENLHSDILGCFEQNQEQCKSLKQSIQETLNAYSVERQKYEEQFLLQQISQMTNFSSDLFAIYKENCEMLRKSVEKLHNKYQIFSMEANTQLVNLLGEKHKYQEAYNSVVNEFREHQTSYLNACAKTFEKFDTFSQQSNSLETQISSAMDRISEFKTNSISIHEHNLQLFDKSEENIQNSEQIIKNHSDSLIGNIKSQSLEDNQKIEKLVEHFHDSLNEISETNIKFKESLPNIVNNVQQNEHTLDKVVEKLTTTHKKCNVECLQEASEFTEKMTKRHDSVRKYVQAELSQRSNEVEKFLREDIELAYNPTGHTPKRREFEYPRKLAATSPKEQILERFRRHRREQMENAANYNQKQIESLENEAHEMTMEELVNTAQDSCDTQVVIEEPTHTSDENNTEEKVEAVYNTHEVTQTKRNGIPVLCIGTQRLNLTEKENNLEALHAKAISEQTTLRRSRRILGEANDNEL